MNNDVQSWLTLGTDIVKELSSNHSSVIGSSSLAVVANIGAQLRPNIVHLRSPYMGVPLLLLLSITYTIKLCKNENNDHYYHTHTTRNYRLQYYITYTILSQLKNKNNETLKKKTPTPLRSSIYRAWERAGVRGKVCTLFTREFPNVEADEYAPLLGTLLPCEGTFLLQIKLVPRYREPIEHRSSGMPIVDHLIRCDAPCGYPRVFLAPSRSSIQKPRGRDACEQEHLAGLPIKVAASRKALNSARNCSTREPLTR